MKLCACKKDKELEDKLLHEGGICPLCGALFLGDIIDVEEEENSENHLSSHNIYAGANDSFNQSVSLSDKDESDKNALATVIDTDSSKHSAPSFGNDFEKDELPTEQTEINVDIKHEIIKTEFPLT